MHKCWFRIYELSVRAMLAYAKLCGDGSYRFDLDRAATESCIKLPVREQTENALFDQLMMMKDHKFKAKENEVIPNLLEVIFYADFSGIFDRNSDDPYYAELQAKAKWLFLPGNVWLDLGGGQKCYCAFERSQSMSRASKLAFIAKDRYENIYSRIMLGMKIGECQLSKLYAYNALMFSDGVRIEGLGLNASSVIVVDNPHYVAPDTDVITVEGKVGGEYINCDHIQKNQDISVLGFDGEGLLSPRLARQICKQLDCDKTSFQIRLPFIKGMLHTVDFHDFFASANTKVITDIWGQQHKVSGVDIILTKSMVKCLGWLKDNGMSWADYWKAFERYDHALYISGMSKDETGDTIQLNYQFVATLSMTSNEFRPADLPFTYPENDTRVWLAKATEKEYHQLCCDNQYRQQFFTSKRYKLGSREQYMKLLLIKNPKLIAEHYYTDMLRKPTRC